MAYGTRGYQSGRGYSGRGRGGGSRGQGFWVGRPEFTGAESNYDRWTIRPLTVPRGDPRPGRFTMALAAAGKEFYNYKKRGGAEGVRERMALGGEEHGEAVARGYMNPMTDAPQAGSRRLDPNPTRPNPTASSGDNRPSGSSIFDPEPRDYEKEQADWEQANPHQAGILNDITGGGSHMPTVGGVVLQAGKKVATKAGRQQIRGAVNEIRGGGGVAGTLDPFEENPNKGKSGFEGTTWENIRGS